MKYLVRLDFRIPFAFGKVTAVLTEEEFKRLEVAAEEEREINPGEIAGKHSDLMGTIDKSDYEVISTNQEEIAVVEKLFGKNYGAFNIMDVIDNEDNGASYDY